jgi:ABC-type branched-subunit amino acid transport system substrate-binding protein
MRAFLLSLGLVLSLTFGVSAQTSSGLTLELGAILPLSGPEQDIGAVQSRALRAALEDAKTSGLNLTLTLSDDRSDLTKSAEQARTLIASGVHALICCTRPEETAVVAPLAAAAGVPLLSPSAYEAQPPDDYWVFSLLASEQAQLERLALETLLAPFALMTPLGEKGDAIARTLARNRAGVARYPAGRTPLTPEALWIATKSPKSVVIWDDVNGTLEAVRALGERGYSGERIVPATIWDDLGALERALLTGAKSILSPAALGYTLADAHPSKAEVSRFRRALIGLPDSFFSETTLTQGAAVWDAVALLSRAAEQVLAYTPEPMSAAALRQGLRDALIGLGPIVAAGGSYDFSEAQHTGPEPASLVIGSWLRGSFRPQ